LEKKKLLIDDLLMKINLISKHETGKELELDTTSLGNPVERKKFLKTMKTLKLSHLEITKHLSNLQSDEILKKALLSSSKTVVRLYAIEAFDLSPRDVGSPSDPYLIIKCNNKTYNERKNYQLDEPNPKFHKCYDFEGIFPGCSPLTIDCMDYDTLFGDELIGTTVVDLEDRYFSIEWSTLREKPIEFRQIYHESTSLSQGVIKMWVEINAANIPLAEQKKWDITPKPPVPIEVRICILNCKGIPMMDFEGTSDVFFKGYFNSSEEI